MTVTEQSKEEKRAKYEAIFPSLVDDLKENAAQYGIPSEALKWYEEVCFLLIVVVHCLKYDIELQH